MGTRLSIDPPASNFFSICIIEGESNARGQKVIPKQVVLFFEIAIYIATLLYANNCSVQGSESTLALACKQQRALPRVG